MDVSSGNNVWVWLIIAVIIVFSIIAGNEAMDDVVCCEKEDCPTCPGGVCPLPCPDGQRRCTASSPCTPLSQSCCLTSGSCGMNRYDSPLSPEEFRYPATSSPATRELYYPPQRPEYSQRPVVEYSRPVGERNFFSQRKSHAPEGRRRAPEKRLNRKDFRGGEVKKRDPVEHFSPRDKRDDSSLDRYLDQIKIDVPEALKKDSGNRTEIWVDEGYLNTLNSRVVSAFQLFGKPLLLLDDNKTVVNVYGVVIAKSTLALDSLSAVGGRLFSLIQGSLHEMTADPKDSSWSWSPVREFRDQSFQSLQASGDQKLLMVTRFAGPEENSNGEALLISCRIFSFEEEDWTEELELKSSPEAVFVLGEGSQDILCIYPEEYVVNPHQEATSVPLSIPKGSLLMEGVLLKPTTEGGRYIPLTNSSHLYLREL